MSAGILKKKIFFISIIAVAAVFSAGCRESPSSDFTLCRLIDRLGRDDIRESPYLAAGEQARNHFLSPWKSFPLSELGVGENPFNIKKKLNLGGAEINGVKVLLMGTNLTDELALKTWWQLHGEAPGAHGLLLGATAAAGLGAGLGDTGAQRQLRHGTLPGALAEIQRFHLQSDRRVDDRLRPGRHPLARRRLGQALSSA